METPLGLPFEKIELAECNCDLKLGLFCYRFEIPEKYLQECTAFITDGDLATKYTRFGRTVGTRRLVSDARAFTTILHDPMQGTPPFMSCNLLDSIGSEASHAVTETLNHLFGATNYGR
jgi:hypothetical protein